MQRSSYPELVRLEIQVDQADDSKRRASDVIKLPRSIHLSLGRIAHVAVLTFKGRRNVRRQLKCERITMSTSFQTDALTAR